MRDGQGSGVGGAERRRDGQLPQPFGRFVGFALAQCWFVAVCLGRSVLGASGTYDALLSPAALPVCSGAAVSSLAVLLLTVRLVPLSRCRGVVWGAGALGTAASALLVLVANGTIGAEPPGALDAAAAVAGAAVAVVVLAWQEYYATCGARAAIPGMACASALGVALFLVTELLPGEVGALVVCLLPAAGCLSLRPKPGTRFYARSSFDITMRHLLGNMLRDYSPRLFVLCGLMTLAFGCGCAVVTPDSPLAGGPAGVFFVCLVGLVMCVACVGVAFSSPRAIMRFFYLAIPLLALAALLLSAGFAGAGTLALFAGAAGVALTYCLVWALMAAMAQVKRLPALGLVAFLHTACFVGAALGMGAVRAAHLGTGTVSIAMLAVLCAAALLFASFNGKVAVAEEMFAAPRATEQELAVAALAERCRLTPRETEVLQLWLAGHNAAYVEQMLHISRNTVKTHLNHVYQKTGATCREDLLALL